MAATYTAGSTADRDRCRLYLGDTNVDAGAFLFDDAEWDDFLATEVSVNKAVALAAETMANRAAQQMDFAADGSRLDAGKQHAYWTKQAIRWRAKGEGVKVVVPTRIDGYSDDVDSDETNANAFLDDL